MNNYKFTFLVWILTVIVFIPLVIVIDEIKNLNPNNSYYNFKDILLIVYGYGVPFSIPSLLCGLIVAYVLETTKIQKKIQQILLLICAILLKKISLFVVFETYISESLLATIAIVLAFSAVFLYQYYFNKKLL